MLHAVIMAGGSGTRFWPASRADRPKQLLDLAGPRTMIQATVDRLQHLVPDDQVLVVTNGRLVEPIRRQLPQLPPAAVIGEPCKRDTAPCIGLAALWVLRSDPDATLLVMPADHVIQPADMFQQAVRRAVQLVEDHPGRLVTFGIVPSYPAESFGYIERGETLLGDVPPAVYRAKRFREKPSRSVAEQYVQSGTFYWNGGIFVWKASTILEALRRFEPEMVAHLDRIAKALETPDFSQVLEHEFSEIRSKSIDFAVMEHYDDVAVIEVAFQWDDLGSWQSLARLHGQDQDGNTAVGKRLLLRRTSGCIVRSDDDHLVATLGLKNCLVVHTPDATLVADKAEEEAVREIVESLQERGWQQYL